MESKAVRDLLRVAKKAVSKRLPESFNPKNTDIYCTVIDTQDIPLLHSDESVLILCQADDYDKRIDKRFLFVGNIDKMKLVELKGLDQFDG